MKHPVAQSRLAHVTQMMSAKLVYVLIRSTTLVLSAVQPLQIVICQKCAQVAPRHALLMSSKMLDLAVVQLLTLRVRNQTHATAVEPV